MNLPSGQATERLQKVRPNSSLQATRYRWHCQPPHAAELKRAPRMTPLRGYAGQDVMCERAAIEGKLPTALRGVQFTPRCWRLSLSMHPPVCDHLNFNGRCIVQPTTPPRRNT